MHTDPLSAGNVLVFPQMTMEYNSLSLWAMAAERSSHLCTWTLTLHINPNGTHPLQSVVPFRPFSPRCWQVKKKKDGVRSLASGQNRDERAPVCSLLTCELVLLYLGKESLLGIHYQ